jgi:DNA-3-methyladenine glycosylase
MRSGGDREPAGVVLPREFFAGSSLTVAPRLLGCVLEHETGEGLVAVLLTEVEAYDGAADPASHAYRGRTSRNAVMFGEPGHAYVYFTYGMHFCVNLVCRPPGTASAVLLRAGRVVEGIALATARREAGRDGARRGPGGSGGARVLGGAGTPGGAGAPGGAGVRDGRGTLEGASTPEHSGGPAAGARGGAVRPVAEHDLARGPARLCQALGIGRSLDGADACDPASPLRIRPPREPSDGRPGPRISRGPRVGISVAADRPWRFWLTGDPTVSPYRPHVPRVRPKPVTSPATEDETMRR